MRSLPLFFLASALLGSSLGQDADGNKRVVDAAPAVPVSQVPVRGGGIAARNCTQLQAQIKDVVCDPADVLEDEDALLQLDAASPPLPAKYHFLEDLKDLRGKVVKCGVTEDNDQGGTCNSCWAFATASAMAHRMCHIRAKSTKKFKYMIPKSLSPYPMICHAWRSFCEAESLEVPLDYLNNYMIGSIGPSEQLGLTGMRNQIGGTISMNHKFGPGSDFFAKVTMPAAQRYSSKNPTPDFCKAVFKSVEDVYGGFISNTPAFMAKGARAVSSSASMRREIFTNGPIVSAMRLTKEFALFYRGSPHVNGKADIFNPAKLTFLDRNGNIAPSDLDEDDWNNHFVVTLGWGYDPRCGANQSYWLIENSWGAIYDRGTLKNVSRKTSLVKICAAIAAMRGLEMTNRPSIGLIKFRALELVGAVDIPVE